MIIELFVRVLFGLVEFVGNFFPVVDPPAFLTALPGHISSVTSMMAPFGNWVPFAAASQAIAVVALAMLAAITIKFIRLLLSLFTGGGGSAA